ncbi:hypothetical protein [Aquabacterium sp. NJ1]|uniref:hypothetical protein n=1 Tax=Aquabacterium sp. NJ1 TaxID=1538295 RepID=UPI00126A4B71|nr:hypothetical protein [Aquabacterium sp. NJ1]
MSHPSARATRKPSALMGWHQTYPTQEQTYSHNLNARQIALRHILRTHYWMTDCKPISAAQVERSRAQLARMAQQDTMTDAEIRDVVSPDFGFEPECDCWTIPDLLEQHAAALDSIEKKSAAGKASARARSSAPPAATPTLPPAQPTAGAYEEF